jgi:hypothetical protein
MHCSVFRLHSDDTTLRDTSIDLLPCSKCDMLNMAFSAHDISSGLF